MSKEPGSGDRIGNGWKVLLGLGLVGPVLAGVAMLPSGASGGEEAATHDHADHTTIRPVRRACRPSSRRCAGPRPGSTGSSGGGGRLRARLGQRLRHEDRRGLCRPPHGWGDGLPLLQRGADGRQRRPPPRARGRWSTQPNDDGGLELVAVEWVVRGPQSNPPGVTETPSVLGMDMHILVPPPGPAFYLTHAWVWATTHRACSRT